MRAIPGATMNRFDGVLGSGRKRDRAPCCWHAAVGAESIVLSGGYEDDADFGSRAFTRGGRATTALRSATPR